ncbi:Bctps2 [Pseudohyphozyma bogoriensis]|nr:Bctps2 [Pseudohyphozyma bogoriensis]
MSNPHDKKDGTLIPVDPKIGKFDDLLPESRRKVLRRLVADPKNVVWIVTWGNFPEVANQLGHIEGLWIVDARGICGMAGGEPSHVGSRVLLQGWENAVHAFVENGLPEGVMLATPPTERGGYQYMFEELVDPRKPSQLARCHEELTRLSFSVAGCFNKAEAVPYACYLDKRHQIAQGVKHPVPFDYMLLIV